MELIYDAINFLIDLLVDIVTGLFGLLPQSPFTFDGFNWGPFGRLIGLIFPAGDMFIHFTALTSAFLIYYGIRWLLRLIKMIQ